MGQPIPFTNRQQSGIEPLAGATVIAMNVIVDAAGAVSRRPGIRTYTEAPETIVDALGIEGLLATDEGRLLAMSSGPGRNLYEIENGSKRLVSKSLLQGTSRPEFAEAEMFVAIAGGREIIKYVKSSRNADFLGGTPPLATHVIAHASRLLANDPTGNNTAIRYSSTFLGNTH